MSWCELDYEDVAEIFKNNLKIDNSVKSISHTFLNERFAKKIDYSPYFQRNYVWDDEKATYFIESILLGTEIPPIVLFDNGVTIEVIDGRQRYETIKRFLENRLSLHPKGLKSLSGIEYFKYNELPEILREGFKTTKIRILQFSIVNEPALTEEREDKVKKEIFSRYNSGIVSLKPEEIERAEFINDPIIGHFKNTLENDHEFFSNCTRLFIARSKQNVKKRNKINYLLSRIRRLLAMPFIPIKNYAGGKRNTVINICYLRFVKELSPESVIDEFNMIMERLLEAQKFLSKNFYELSVNPLFFEALYWGYSIVNKKGLLEKIDSTTLFNDLASNIDAQNLWNNIELEDKNVELLYYSTGSHYREAIINRYTFISNFLQKNYNLDLSEYLLNNDAYKNLMKNDIGIKQFEDFKLSKADPMSSTIYDILLDIKNSRFLIRPDYQRSEVTNRQKASYLIESIILGIRLPPLFIFRREDGVCEVIDGQQRLLSIIGFLGESYIDENEETSLSDKHLFKLSKLRILDELNGSNIEDIEVDEPKYKDNILDFPIDIVEISQSQNPNFRAIDLFLRLNSKPYPIEPNTFEMWNGYLDKQMLDEIKRVARQYNGTFLRQANSRMKNEELIAIFIYLSATQRIRGEKSSELIDIYVRNARVNARLRNKNNVTTTLEQISREQMTSFPEYVKDVQDFIDKMAILTGDKFERLNELFAPKIKNALSRTNQNYYFLWIMLNSVEKSILKSQGKRYFEEIKRSFIRSQNMDEELTADNFIQTINNIRCEL